MRQIGSSACPDLRASKLVIARLPGGLASRRGDTPDDQQERQPGCRGREKATARQFRQFSPVFPVRDLAAALARYSALGFSTDAYGDGDDYGFAGREGSHTGPDGNLIRFGSPADGQGHVPWAVRLARPAPDAITGEPR